MKILSKALIGIAAIALASTASFAADLPVQQSYKAPVAVIPVYNWTGFYIGGNAGYGWADQTLTVSGVGSAGVIDQSLNGFVGGAQIGYNWQIPNNFVFGIEADIMGSTAKETVTGAVTIAGVAVTATTTNKLDYLGTVRGRFGYAAGTWMPYVTGGWAYGGGSSTVTATGAGVAFTGTGSSSRTDGWVLGGGVEWMLSPNWIAGVEYLYVNFSGDSATAGGVTISTDDLTANIVRGRINYKF